MREVRNLWSHTKGEVSPLTDAYRHEQWPEGVWMPADGHDYFVMGEDLFESEREALHAARGWLNEEITRLWTLEARLKRREAEMNQQAPPSSGAPEPG